MQFFNRFFTDTCNVIFERQGWIKVYTEQYLFLFIFTLLQSMLILTDFSVVTRRWHLSPYGFIWNSSNRVNRLSVQFSNLLKKCINLSHVCEVYYHQHSWQYYTRIFQKNRSQMLILKSGWPNIEPCGTPYAISGELL